MKDMQVHLEEEQRVASEMREHLGIAERRAHALNGELEESRTLLEQSDRGRRQADSDLADAAETISQLTSQNGSLTIAKRKLENEMQTLQVRLSWYLNFVTATTTVTRLRKGRLKVIKQSAQTR